MSTIPPQILSLVNELPKGAQQPVLRLLLDLTSIFKVSGGRTPSSFASAESELVAAVIRLGRDADLALAAEEVMTWNTAQSDNQMPAI